jgi:hypothetical protein
VPGNRDRPLSSVLGIAGLPEEQVGPPVPRADTFCGRVKRRTWLPVDR